MKYQHIVTQVFRRPWAILPEKLQVITELVALRASGEKLTEQEIRARLEAAALNAGPRNAQSFGAVAVIPIHGVISQRMGLMSSMSGGASVEGVTAAFRKALADQTVKAIVFDVDSPGGSVEGVPELADEIYKARSRKKTVAVANSMAASAAYWLASSAGELVVTPSGQVGSVGVYCAHEDVSEMYKSMGVNVSLISAGKYKTELSGFGPLSDEARAALQDQVNAFYSMFVKAVGRGRRASQDDVRSGFGQGRMVLAADAVKEGMVDRVATMDETLERLGGNASSNSRTAAAAAGAAVRSDIGDGDDPLDPECQCLCEGCQADDCESCANEACADRACAEEGCPNQTQARAAADIDRRRRELDLLTI